MTDRDILEIAMQQSAIDCGCNPDDFTKSTTITSVSVASADARKYLELPHICNMVSYGNNIVICGKEKLLPELREYVESAPSPYSCMETPRLHKLNRILEKENATVCFMAEYFLPRLEELDRFTPRCEYELRLLHQADFAPLYLPQWSNALCEKRKELDVLGIGAYDGDTLVGLAGCSADCNDMWQIGIDVLPDYRRQGIASTLTNVLAKEILARGKVPFYCAAWSNLKSVNNAVKSAFRPAWVELTAKPIPFTENLI